MSDILGLTYARKVLEGVELDDHCTYRGVSLKHFSRDDLQRIAQLAIEEQKRKSNRYLEDLKFTRELESARRGDT